ncbi:hypothetical protein JHD50_02520 [Sulfurimonas sp. MAG313]|nr:hypothetical protein [Sulfurimonas sp. MAG313]MDF1880186.1 hypothetical protein [Sulfurimonas sp. MAG313]
MLKTLLIILAMTFILTGCNQPKKVEKAQLDNDIQNLMALNTSYKNKDIDAMTYLKQSRKLNKKIHAEEELLGNGHTHQH